MNEFLSVVIAVGGLAAVPLWIWWRGRLGDTRVERFRPQLEAHGFALFDKWTREFVGEVNGRRVVIKHVRPVSNRYRNMELGWRVTVRGEFGEVAPFLITAPPRFRPSMWGERFDVRGEGDREAVLARFSPELLDDIEKVMWAQRLDDRRSLMSGSVGVVDDAVVAEARVVNKPETVLHAARTAVRVLEALEARHDAQPTERQASLHEGRVSGSAVETVLD